MSELPSTRREPAPADGDLLVRDDPSRSRFELVRDGLVIGLVDYVVDGDVVVVPHTEIDPAWQGHGFGVRLVAGVLDELRTRGCSVVPTCSFVRRFVHDHPEYRDLLAAD